MFLRRNTHEAYWNSYRLLENQLLRLAHSIRFDDDQIGVYSSELADIINSACIKIESLAKDIYGEHIWPFQADNGVVPKSFTDGKKKKRADKFDAKKWTRKNWKFDYNCLVEIDNRFLLSKKRVELKIEKFHFQKYGSTILPFGNISPKDCKGGYWEYFDRDPWATDLYKLQDVDWCKSYQAIKHNYIHSISTHGTIKNAIMALAAFYLLAVFNSCLPSRQFEMEDKAGKHQLDFGSEMFSCGMCNFTVPPCIINSERLQQEAERKEQAAKLNRPRAFVEQDLLSDIEGFPFLITLNKEACSQVNSMVEQYCSSSGVKHFDIASHPKSSDVRSMDASDVLYINLKQYITPPYRKSHVCISFNTGTDSVYDNLFIDYDEYEKSKYKNQTAKVLTELKVGDVVDAKFLSDEEVPNGEVVKIDEISIDLAVQVNGKSCITSQPKDNLIYIQKLR